jgi:alpha-mannosidase
MENLTPAEREIWKALGIPAEDARIRRVVFLDDFSHMDWDWLATFDDYYENDHCFDGFTQHAVRTILQAAADAFTAPVATDPPFRWSVCEVAFLERFAADRPDGFAKLTAAGDRLRIVGGGMVSPDSLVPDGEVILRNFLLGNTWVRGAFPVAPPGGGAPLPPLRQVWLPDNFGHDAQLPVLLEAMGIQGVGFARIPGDPLQFWAFPGPDGGPDLAAAQLTRDGSDFVWLAADGSTTLAHWMPQAYFQGQNIKGDGALGQLEQAYGFNAPLSPTPYVYVPVANDFSRPVPTLPATAAEWNRTRLADTGAWAVAASFDDYLRLVACRPSALRTRGTPTGGGVLPFLPTPYWMGFYASRPELRVLHHAAVRALLAAEAFALAADRLTGGWTAADATIARGWADLVPSTHHDYITGTAANAVYADEQVPLLREALREGEAAREMALDRLAAFLPAPRGGGVPAAVFNPLGFARGGLAELPAFDGPVPAGVVAADGSSAPVQRTAEGGWIFRAPREVGALGWQVVSLTSDPAAPGPAATVTASPDGGSVTLANDHLSARLDAAQAWGVASLRTAAGAEVLRGAAHVPLFFPDSGNMWQLGSERAPFPAAAAATLRGAVVEVLEEGPVRARVRVTGSFAVAGVGQPVRVAREYALVAGEPFLRLTATLAAPHPYSVMVPVPFAGAAVGLVHGTPAHWDAQPSVPPFNADHGGTPPVFACTQRYVVARGADGAPLGAVLHAHLPAWAVAKDGSLLGVLARNPTAGSHAGMEGPGDPDEHTVEYALRVPGGIATPETGAQLCEALAFAAPHLARPLPSGGGGALPPAWSLAAPSDPRALVAAAKAGTVPGESEGALVLRVYQPTNAAIPLTLALGAGLGGASGARGANALELPLPTDAEAALEVTASGDEIDFTARRALTTLLVPAPR